jgi:hypothetical protein
MLCIYKLVKVIKRQGGQAFNAEKSRSKEPFLWDDSRKLKEKENYEKRNNWYFGMHDADEYINYCREKQ